jgi:hypothetical protein
MLLPSARTVILAKREFLKIVRMMRKARNNQEGSQEIVLQPVLNGFRVDYYGSKKYIAHHKASQCRDCLSPVCVECRDCYDIDKCKYIIYCKLCTLKKKQERGRIRREKYQAKYIIKYADKLAERNL